MKIIPSPRPRAKLINLAANDNDGTPPPGLSGWMFKPVETWTHADHDQAIAFTLNQYRGRA